MSRKKKRKKTSVGNAIGGYKNYLRQLNKITTMIRFDENLSELSESTKRNMYFYSRVGIRNLIAANDFITSAELKTLGSKIKRNYREPIHEFKEYKASSYQFRVLYSYMTVRLDEAKKRWGEYDKTVVDYKKVTDRLFNVFSNNMCLDFMRAAIQLSAPDKKHYSLKLGVAPIIDKNPVFDMKLEAYGAPARRINFKVDGINRPAYKMATPNANEPPKWITVNSLLLNGKYKSTSDKLEVYIQSHALQRLKERLDLLDSHTINYALWSNTVNINTFQRHKDFLLLPFEIHDIKIGYLVANIIDNKILFRTFLFITHNSTPEGDTLKEITGLGKRDISYWQIDRLSTFVNFNEDKYPGITQLFIQAGLEELLQLKHKNFDCQAIQEANLDGLRKYILKGKHAEKVQEKEFMSLMEQ